MPPVDNEGSREDEGMSGIISDEVDLSVAEEGEVSGKSLMWEYMLCPVNATILTRLSVLCSLLRGVKNLWIHTGKMI